MPRKSSVRVTVSVRVGDEPGRWPSVDVPPRAPAPLAVTLPDIPSVPEAWRGARYVVRSLLGSGDSNPKLRKSNQAGTPYRTWGLALAPATGLHSTSMDHRPRCGPTTELLTN